MTKIYSKTEKYEFFEHTADAKFRAYGRNYEEMFTNAALAMTSIMIDPLSVERHKEKKIKVIGDDMGSLLYNFLEELLFIFDTEFIVVSTVAYMKIEPKDKGFELSCTIIGDIAEKYRISTHIKAMTYNDLEITADYVQVVVDL